MFFPTLLKPQISVQKKKKKTYLAVMFDFILLWRVTINVKSISVSVNFRSAGSYEGTVRL